MEPHSHSHIHASAFTQQQFLCSSYAAVRLTLQHFFTALTPLHWSSCSHAAAFVQHLTRHCISVGVFTLLSRCSTGIFAASFKLQLLHATALQVLGAHLPTLSMMPAGRSPSWLAGRGREGSVFVFWRGGSVWLVRVEKPSGWATVFPVLLTIQGPEENNGLALSVAFAETIQWLKSCPCTRPVHLTE